MHETRIDRLLQDIRTAYQSSGMTLGELAERAHLHENTLLRLKDPSWQPRADTIRRLEGVLLAGQHRQAGRPRNKS